MNLTNINREKIKDAVVKSIEWDARINSGHIEVKYGNGKVTLNGKVNKHMEIRAAEEDAWCVEGVTEVDNELEMKKEQTIKVSDSAVKSGFRNLLNWNVHFDASKIQIDVQDGEMTLSGSVDNYWEKNKAEELAYDMIGIIYVNNKLNITGENISDKDLNDIIMFFLEKKQQGMMSELSVKVKDGNVHFYGEIPKNVCSLNPVYFIRNFRGVKNIKKDLKYVPKNGYN